MNTDLSSLTNAVTAANPHLLPAMPQQRVRIVFPDSSSDDDANNNNKEDKPKKGPIFVAVPVDTGYNFSANEEDFVDPLLVTDPNERQPPGEDDEDQQQQDQNQQQQQRDQEQREAPRRRGRYNPPSAEELRAAQEREEAQKQRQAQQQQQNEQQEEPRPLRDVLIKDGYTWDTNPYVYYHNPHSSRDDIIADRQRVAESNKHKKNKEDNEDEDDENIPASAAALLLAGAQQQRQQQSSATNKTKKIVPPAIPPIIAGALLPLGLGEALTDFEKAAAEQEEKRKTMAATSASTNENAGEEAAEEDDASLPDIDFEGLDDDGEEDEEDIDNELDELVLVEAVRQMVDVCVQQIADCAVDDVDVVVEKKEEAKTDDAEEQTKKEQPQQGQAQEQPATAAVAAKDAFTVNEEAASGRAHRASFERFVAVARPLLAAFEAGKMTIDEFVEESSAPMLQIQRVLRMWSRPPAAPKVVIDGKVCDL